MAVDMHEQTHLIVAADGALRQAYSISSNGTLHDVQSPSVVATRLKRVADFDVTVSSVANQPVVGNRCPSIDSVKSPRAGRCQRLLLSIYLSAVRERNRGLPMPFFTRQPVSNKRQHHMLSDQVRSCGHRKTDGDRPPHSLIQSVLI